MHTDSIFSRLRCQSDAFSRTERKMIVLQWGVMLAVAVVAVVAQHPTNVLYGTSLTVLLFGTVLVHPLCYEVVLRLAGPWFAVHLAARHAALTAVDVTVATTLYYEAVTMHQPEFAQILLFCVVALAATRYQLVQAIGITSLLSLLLVVPLLLLLANATYPHKALIPTSTLISSTLSLYVVTYLVALLRAAERRADGAAQNNERLYRTVLGYNRELNAINHLIHVLAPQENIAAILAEALAVICLAMGSPLGSAYLVEDGLPVLVARQGEWSTAGPGEGVAAGVEEAIRRRDLIVARAPLVATSSITVPLIASDDVLGVLQVALDDWEGPAEPDERPEMERLQILCRELAVALDNALLRHKVQQSALLQEKNRIAQELHDTVAQILFSIGLGLEWCLRQVAEDGEVHAKLLDLKRLSGQGTTEIRSAIFTLASNIGQGEIVPAVRTLVTDLGQKYGWETNVVVTGSPTQPPLLVQNAIHRIVREGMINTYKHAQASEVMVSLRFAPHQVTVVVQDDGRGRAADLNAAMAGHNSHFGLRTVQTQVNDLGGSFDVYDADERGIVLRATIPTTPHGQQAGGTSLLLPPDWHQEDRAETRQPVSAGVGGSRT